MTALLFLILAALVIGSVVRAEQRRRARERRRSAFFGSMRPYSSDQHWRAR